MCQRIERLSAELDSRHGPGSAAAVFACTAADIAARMGWKTHTVSKLNLTTKEFALVRALKNPSPPRPAELPPPPAQTAPAPAPTVQTPEQRFAALCAEQRVKTAGKWLWKQVGKRPNHYLDCEAMQAAAATMLKLIGREAVVNEDAASEDAAVDAPESA